MSWLHKVEILARAFGERCVVDTALDTIVSVVYRGVAAQYVGELSGCATRFFGF